MILGVTYEPKLPAEIGITPPRAELKIVGVPGDSVDYTEWIRSMLATVVAVVFADGEKRDKLLDLSMMYKERVKEIITDEELELETSEVGDVYYSELERDDRWYLLWTRKFHSGWAVIRHYGVRSVTTVVPNSNFWLTPYGSCTHDGYLSEDEALEEFKDVLKTRIEHGYRAVRVGRVVDGSRLEPDGSIEDVDEVMEVLECPKPLNPREL